MDQHTQQEAKTWTIHNKIEMYKGLISMLTQEIENQSHDLKLKTLETEKNEKKISKLRLEIKELNEVCGADGCANEINASTALQEHKELQLVFAHNSPEEVNKELDQKLFDKEKVLNELTYKIAMEETNLLNQHLELNRLKNMIEIANDDTHDRMISSKTLEAQNKLKSLNNVGAILEQAYNILYKENTKHEDILKTLKNNGKEQQSCIIRAMEMGQLAQEDTTNMRQEGQRMLELVRKTMADQEISLGYLKEQLAQLIQDSQKLLPTQWIGKLGLYDDSIEDETETDEQTNEVKSQMRKLQKETAVSQISDLQPRVMDMLQRSYTLHEDIYSKEINLAQLSKEIEQGRWILANTIQDGEATSSKHNAKLRALQGELDRVTTEHAEMVKARDGLARIAVQLHDGIERLADVAVSIPLPDYELPINMDVPTPDTGIATHALVYTEISKEKCKRLQDQRLTGLKTDEQHKKQIMALRAIREMKRAHMKANFEQEKPMPRASVGEKSEVHDPLVRTFEDIMKESKAVCEQANRDPFEEIK